MRHTKIALTGASGFVGKEIQKYFPDTVIIKRDDNEAEISKKLQDVDVVINLAGAPIVKRWSEAYKKVLYSSRIETTKRVVSAINKSDISYFISTSAIGIYPNDMPCDERCTEADKGFLGTLCQAWEAEAHQCTKPTAILRFGVVLGKEGGALQKMLLPFKLGLGGTIGNGEMMMSWIALSDLMRMYQYLVENKLEGVFNAVSPTPVNNTTFTESLGKALHRPTFLPLPAFVLNLLYGEGASVLLDSKEVYPRTILDKGFVFHFDNITTLFTKNDFL